MGESRPALGSYQKSPMKSETVKELEEVKSEKLLIFFHAQTFSTFNVPLKHRYISRAESVRSDPSQKPSYKFTEGT